MLQTARLPSTSRFVSVLAAVLFGVFLASTGWAAENDDTETRITLPRTTVWPLGLSYQPDWSPVEAAAGTIASGDVTAGVGTARFSGPNGSGIALEHPPTSTREGDRERLRWNREEKAWLYSYFALNAVDAYQTMNIPAGMAEGNPLLSGLAGDRPSTIETLAYKAAITYGVVKLTERMRSRKARRVVLILVNSIQLSVNVNNERVTGGILF